MAHQINVVLVDDITMEPASETVQFSMDGISYEIDLSEKNAKKFRAAVAPFMEHARPAKRKSRPSNPDSDVAKVRLWARENGMHVNERGRIPAVVMEAYNRSREASQVVE